MKIAYSPPLRSRSQLCEKSSQNACNIGLLQTETDAYRFVDALHLNLRYFAEVFLYTHLVDGDKLFCKNHRGAAEIFNSLNERMGRCNVSEDLAVDLKVINSEGAERIVRLAFEYASNNGINRVSAVTKANLIKTTYGKVLEIALRVAA